jgi:ABC-type nitrate/sulfonate/bicarbonate transport system substrate-binding protein
MHYRMLGLMMLAAICGAAPAGAAEKVAIGMAAGLNRLPSLVAQTKGFFKEQDLDVDVKIVPRGQVAIEALTSGSVQFSESAHAPFMSAVSKGLPLIAVGVSSRGYLGKLVGAPKYAGLKTLADFRGKQIGIQVGTGAHTVILMLLEKEGLKPSDFNFTNLRVVDMPAAMAAGGRFDAVIGWEPGMHRIVQSGHGQVNIDADAFEKAAQITYPFLISTTRQFHKDHPDVVQRLLNGYAKADKFIREHHDEAVKIYVDDINQHGGKLTADVAQAMLFDTDRFGGPAFTAGDMQDLPATRDFLIKTGKLKALPPFDDIIDQSFGKKAEAMLAQ